MSKICGLGWREERSNKEPLDILGAEIGGRTSREIGDRLMSFCLLLVGRLGRVVARFFLSSLAGFRGESSLCQARCVSARCAGVVRWPVVRYARRAKRDRVRIVVPPNARYAGVIACWCGTFMRAAGQPEWPARPTRRSSRPLRAQDRWFFGSLCSACGG